MSSDMWLLDAARHQIDQLCALRISVHPIKLSLEFRLHCGRRYVDSERSIDYAESQYYVVLTGLCHTGCVKGVVSNFIVHVVV